jgi:hypothetical protein
MLLQHGRKTAEGPSDDVIDEYIRSVRAGTTIRLDERPDREGTGRLRFASLVIEQGGEPSDIVRTGEDVDIVLGYESRNREPVRHVGLAVSIYDLLGARLLNLTTELAGDAFDELTGEGSVRCRIPRLPLPDGTYILNVYAHSGGETLDWVQRATELTVAGGDFYGSGQAPPQDHRAVLVDYSWLRD